MLAAPKRRSFMTELLLSIMLLIVVPLIIIAVVVYRHELGGMNKIEQEKSQLANQTAQKSIARLGDTILGVTISNGYWEANRQAILTKDQAWLDENISDMPGVVPNVDFVAEADLQGSVLVQAGGVAEFERTIGFKSIMERFKKEKKFTGLFNTSKGVAVIAVSEVTGNVGDGEPAGILVTGRLLTDEILTGLKDTLQTDITLLLEGGQYLSTGEFDGEASLTAGLDKPMNGDDTVYELTRQDGLFVARTKAALSDMSGKPIGVIVTEIPAKQTGEAVNGLRSIGLYTLLVMSVLVVIVIALIRHRILVPLRHFSTMVQEVASGREVPDVPSHVMRAEAEIVNAVQGIRKLNVTLEQTVKRRTAEIRTLLDNAKQGFMTVGPDLLVGGEYSSECKRLFGVEIAGAALPELLYPDDEQERELLASIVTELFAETDELKKELIFSLLPEELSIAGCIVQADYKLLAAGGEAGAVLGEQMMIVLTDLSEKRRLEEQMSRERQMLKMVVQVVSNRDDFAQLTADYRRFCRKELPKLIPGSLEPGRKLMSLYKTVHTFKGNFAFLQFMHIVPKLHELETSVLKLLDRDPAPDAGETQTFMSGLEMDGWLDQDLGLLKHTLGDAFEELGTENAIQLNKEQWRQLESMLRELLNEKQETFRRFKRWGAKPVKSLLKHYPAYLMELASRKGILLQPVELLGGDMPVDSVKLYDFSRSLIHVVRNIVVHGIETPEERMELGKPEMGRVTFKAEQSSQELIVTITDDGRGIDLEAVRAQAERHGIDVESASEQELAALVFAERISTSVQTTELAGRGIGLSAVKQEVEKLGGTVRIETAYGAGTSFIFQLPHEPQL